jgi:hypothetical protein
MSCIYDYIRIDAVLFLLFLLYFFLFCCFISFFINTHKRNIISKVVDKLWVGSTGTSLLPGAGNYEMDFLFGCQTSETGLFRTQLADGIMGMSNAEDTLPNQLFQKKVTTTKIFALCYRVGGGENVFQFIFYLFSFQNFLNFLRFFFRLPILYIVHVLQVS